MIKFANIEEEYYVNLTLRVQGNIEWSVNTDLNKIFRYCWTDMQIENHLVDGPNWAVEDVEAGIE